MSPSSAAVAFRQLASMLSAGLTTTAALEAAGWGAVAGVVSGGGKLTAALSQVGLDPVHLRALEAGEVSGTMPEVLNALADDLESRIRMRRSVVAGLVYPVVLVHAAVLLPPLVLLFTSGVAAYLAATLIPLAALYAIGTAALLLLRRLGDSFPPFYRSSLLRFLDAFALLYRAGVPIHDALEAAAQPAGRRVRAQIAAIHAAIRAGRTLGEAFRASDLPRPVRELIATGDQSGRLDDLSAKARDMVRGEVEHTRRMAARILPIVAYLAAAAYVAVLVIRFYLSRFEGLL